MSQTVVEFEIANHADIVRAQAGHIDAARVRRMRLRGHLDPEAAQLTLPVDVLATIGITPVGSVEMRADGQETCLRPLCENVYLELDGCAGVFNAVAGPPQSFPSLGVAVLADFGIPF